MPRFPFCFGKSRKQKSKEKNTLSTTNPSLENQDQSSQTTGHVTSLSLQEADTPSHSPQSGNQSKITTAIVTNMAQDNPDGQKQPIKPDPSHLETPVTVSLSSTVDSHMGITAPSNTGPAEGNRNVESEPTNSIPSGIQEMGPDTSEDVPSTGLQHQGTSSPANFSMDSTIYSTRGRGLCIIMANFIPQNLREHEAPIVLPGYKKDIESLIEVFQSEKFDFDVKTELNGLAFRNLSSKQFRKALCNIQQHIMDRDKEGKPRYDKFLMFVLSHGGEAGIHMCEENSNGREEEIVNKEVCVITQDEIIDGFTHDRVSPLKGVPKCFFFQACRGSGLTHAAAEPWVDVTSDQNEALSLPSVTKKNILLVYASLDTKKSYVHSEKGSWFIQNLVSVLRKQSERKDILEMLTEMTAVTSTKIKKEWFVCNSKNCIIKVNWEKQRCPVTVVGKPNQANSTGMDEAHTYRPVFVSRNRYTGFAQTDDFSLHSYDFTGTICCLPYEDQQLDFKDWVPAKDLKVFENEKHFKIDGQLKNQHAETKKGIIKVEDDKWEVEPIRQKGKIGPVKLEVKHGENRITVPDPNKLGQAFVYISDRFCGSGPLKQDKDGVWGVEVEMYQLPVFTSTLTKQLFLAKLNKRENVNEIINKEVEERVASKVSELIAKHLKTLVSKVMEESPDSNIDVNAERPLSENLPSQ